MLATLEKLQEKRKVINSSSKRSHSTPMQLSQHDHPSQALLYMGYLLLLILAKRGVNPGAFELARSKSSPGKHLPEFAMQHLP
jgi:hypothetical protein